MEPDYSLKRGDTWPPIAAQLTSRDRSSSDARARVAIDLTDATAVKLLLRNIAETMSFGGNCEIVDAAHGDVQWAIDPAFSAVADLFSAEFEIHWSDGSIQTVPDSGYAVIEVEQDLG